MIVSTILLVDVALRDFFNKHYSSNLMALVIKSNNALDVME